MQNKVKRKYFVLTFIFFAILPFSIGAVELNEDDFNFVTTEDLYSLCSIEADHPDYAPSIYACRGYIAGAVDYHDGVSNNKDMKRLICYPEKTTLKDGREAFVAWAKTREGDPDIMQDQAVIGLVTALATRYPCKQ